MDKIKFGNEGICALPLSLWLDFCARNRTESYITLPLIQRGSVWKPNQIIDLWDSLLRGMPVGSFMVNDIPTGTLVRLPGQNESQHLEKEAFGLLDGQQRTLAMLAGWPLHKGQPLMDRRVWVDFADTPGKEHLLRLRVTTANHPFGFRRDDAKAKLSLSDRRKAIMAWQEAYGSKEDASAVVDKQVMAAQNIHKPKQVEHIDFRADGVMPYSVVNSLSVDLADLIADYTPDSEAFTDILQKKLEAIKNCRAINRTEGEKQRFECVDVWRFLSLSDKENILKRVKLLHSALSRLLTSLHVPLIKIDMNAIQDNDLEIDEDPALAILFRRVGANGTSLSNADYIFSLIKHSCPETHDLVNKLYERKRDYNLAALLAPATLVSTAVRLAVTRCSDEKAKPWPDSLELDKRRFARLLGERVFVNGDSGSFLALAFLPLIKEERALSMAALFNALEDLLIYKEKGDFGLPAHALWLIKKPLLQLLLFWGQALRADKSKMHTQRREVIRFIMFWSLCIKDADKACMSAYKLIREKGDSFLFSELVESLVAEGLALPFYSPDELKRLIAGVISMPVDERDEHPLKGWSRFAPKKDETATITQARQLYLRWWGQRGHVHPLLLWLQRDYVAAELAGSPADGREEDTPYDYDHILPASHWSDWTGQGNNPDRIANFMPINDGHYGVVGNSIGNIRVWSSSDNRSDGDLPPSGKLISEEIYVASAIDFGQKGLWDKCSTETGKYRTWSRERAWSFQKVVEQRAWKLYEQFYSDLGLAGWQVSSNH